MSVGKGRAGHRAGPSRPLQLSLSPLSSPDGGFPARHPIRRYAGAAPGHSSAPALSRPLHLFLPRSGNGVASPFRCPRSGTALADPRAVFFFPGRSA